MTENNFFQTPYKALYCMNGGAITTMKRIEPTDKDVKLVDALSNPSKNTLTSISGEMNC